MSDILRRAIFTAQADSELDVSIGDYERLEKWLSLDTKKMVDKSGINLHVLAALIHMTLCEATSNADIDRVFNEKFHNQDLVINLMAKYRDEVY